MRRRLVAASHLLTPVARTRPLVLSHARWNATLAVDSSSAVAGRDDVGGSSLGSSNSTSKAQGTFFLDLVFPIRFGSLDIRVYFAAFRERVILESLTQLLENVNTNGFKLLSVDPSRAKDGGVFVHFEYDAAVGESSLPAQLDQIYAAIREKAQESGGIPSWSPFRSGEIWRVRGEPWTEDMRRYASRVLKVEFEGPDVHQEELYRAFRTYGMIEDITPPTPVPAGALRSSKIIFNRVRYAVRAHNCLHGLVLPSANNAAKTRLAILYEQPLQGHAIRDWMTSHPRIVLPVLAFLLGTLTYTVFDPVRSAMVQAKVENWFDYRDYAVVQWVKRNTIDRLSINFSTEKPDEGPGIVWAERKAAESEVERYLNDLPDTVAFLYGPAGSGKSSLVHRLVSDQKRPHIIIDCAAIYNAKSDAEVITQIASQTGYFPVFSGLAWVNSMIDLASASLIGQKAGFSKSLDEQFKDVLDVVGAALKRVNASHHKNLATLHERILLLEEREREEKRKRHAIHHGMFHDPRLDCIAGNGIMSELGLGDERLDDVVDSWDDWEAEEKAGAGVEAGTKSLEGKPKTSPAPAPVMATPRESDLAGLPIVVLKNYDAKGATKREALLEVLANWSTALIENQVAHVIVASTNRESQKRLAKALGTRPLASVALLDADANSALSIVSSRLQEVEGTDVSRELSAKEVEKIGRLGGRSSDLDALVYKVKNGMSVEAAVEDIIVRTLGELRKNTFGDDSEDAKSVPWKREQAWHIISRLATREEIQYSETLLEFPFKGDDLALREMEKAELISIVTDDGFPVAIRPGRPVYYHVFQRLAKDPLFAAVQEIATNEKLITSAEATVKACEDELITLRTIGFDVGRSLLHGHGSPAMRADFLLQKMEASVVKIGKLERTNSQLKKLLATHDKGRR
ncbi:hypothetical protein DL93DRAFT_2102538 [Clavulina sp. PMI_390]|nr:hypothetical protein DL93DRAFT_2102538 [Clavulina sp. PMI_390]